MNSTTYKYIALLVIGILVGYLFGVSMANKDDSKTFDTDNTEEQLDTNASSTTSSTDSDPGYINGQPDGTSPSTAYVKDITSSTVNPGTIVVSDQIAMSSVHIDKIILEQDSWIAIHEYKYGDLAGFIIGAHKKPAGVYTNLDLWVNRKLTPGEKYIVAIHKDDGVEGFNYKTDTPRINSDGKVVAAVFTATE